MDRDQFEPNEIVTYVRELISGRFHSLVKELSHDHVPSIADHVAQLGILAQKLQMCSEWLPQLSNLRNKLTQHASDARIVISQYDQAAPADHWVSQSALPAVDKMLKDLSSANEGG